MKYIETGFRAVYDNFTAFPVNEKTGEWIKGMPGESEASCILTFGYIGDDHEVRLEIIACGKQEGSTFRFFNADEKRRSFKAEDVSSVEFMFLDRRDGSLGKRYESKLEAIEDADDEILETRRMGFIDKEREPYRPDVVKVYLAKKGLRTEPVKTLIKGMGENSIIGTLLENPEQNFGAVCGDDIAFVLQEIEEGRVIMAANMARKRKLKEEDLEDGRLLKNTIGIFMKDRNEDTYIDVLEILRDSELWVPCNIILSEMDQKRMDMMVNNVLADRMAPQGGFLNQDAIRAMPEYLKRDDEVFLPIFTSEDEMKSFGEKYTKVRKPVLEWMDIAEKNEHGVAGMVINPFTDCFILRTDIFEAIRKIKSSIDKM